MTGTAAAARATNARDVRNSLQSAAQNFSFNRALRNKETRTDQSFLTAPLLARRIAELANRSQQRITRESRTMFSTGFRRLSPVLNFGELAPQYVTILPDDGGLGSRNVHNPLGQHRRGRNEHTTPCRLKPRLRNPLFLIDLNRNPHVRAANQRRRTTNKTRLVRISYISRVEKMIRSVLRQKLTPLLKLLALLPFVKNSSNQLRFFRQLLIKSTL